MIITFSESTKVDVCVLTEYNWSFLKILFSFHSLGMSLHWKIFVFRPWESDWHIFLIPSIFVYTIIFKQEKGSVQVLTLGYWLESLFHHHGGVILAICLTLTQLFSSCLLHNIRRGEHKLLPLSFLLHLLASPCCLQDCFSLFTPHCLSFLNMLSLRCHHLGLWA